MLADRYQGKRLNSPNDVVEQAGGAIWFTDPTYGIATDYEGHQADSEIGASQVYRIDPGSARVELVAGDFTQPNGLALAATSGSSTFRTARNGASGCSG